MEECFGWAWNILCWVHWSSEDKYQLQPVDLTEYASLLVWGDDEHTASGTLSVATKNEKVEIIQLMCHLKYIFVPGYFRS